MNEQLSRENDDCISDLNTLAAHIIAKPIGKERNQELVTINAQRCILLTNKEIIAQGLTEGVMENIEAVRLAIFDLQLAHSDTIIPSEIIDAEPKSQIRLKA